MIVLNTHNITIKKSLFSKKYELWKTIWSNDCDGYWHRDIFSHYITEEEYMKIREKVHANVIK